MNQRVFCFGGLAAGTAVLTALDQWTKSLAVEHLMNQQPLVILEGVFELYYSENRGAAFGMLQGRQFLFAFIALAVLAASIYCFSRIPLRRRFIPLGVCVTMICSGAIGNLIDRLSQGYVVDFLYFRLINFPIFNVADCYVTVGAFLLVLLLFFYYKEEELSCFSFSRKKGEN